MLDMTMWKHNHGLWRGAEEIRKLSMLLFTTTEILLQCTRFRAEMR